MSLQLLKSEVDSTLKYVVNYITLFLLKMHL
jgi:hypothetical protein